MQAEGQIQTFSIELQSKIFAIHAAALAGAGKYRNALSHMDSAATMNKRNEGLQRDLELMRRIVENLE